MTYGGRRPGDQRHRRRPVFAKSYSYDSLGNRVGQQYSRAVFNGDGNRHPHHHLRLAEIARSAVRPKAVNGSTTTFGDTTDQYYDAYGEGGGPGRQYRRRGRPAPRNTRTTTPRAGSGAPNMTDGVSRAYAYDYNGNSTFLFQTSGATDLKQQTSIASIFVDSTNLNSAVTVTVTVYDSRKPGHRHDPARPSNQTNTPIRAVEVNTNNQGRPVLSPPISAPAATGPQHDRALASSRPYPLDFGTTQPGGAPWGYGSRGGHVLFQAQYLNDDPLPVYDPNGPWDRYYPRFSVSTPGRRRSLGRVDLPCAAQMGSKSPRSCREAGAYYYDPRYNRLLPNAGRSAGPDVPDLLPVERGTWSVEQDMPEGRRSLGSVYVDGYGTASSLGVNPAVELCGINSGATAVRCFVRLSGSGGSYVEVDASQKRRQTIGTINADANSPFNGAYASSWEVRYMAFDASGHILNAADGPPDDRRLRPSVLLTLRRLRRRRRPIDAGELRPL